MNYLGIEYNLKHAPKLDPNFIPFGVWRAAYLKDAKQPIAIAIERDKGCISVHHSYVHGTDAMKEADYRYVERYVKFLLWSIGGLNIPPQTLLLQQSSLSMLITTPSSQLLKTKTFFLNPPLFLYATLNLSENLVGCTF